LETKLKDAQTEEDRESIQKDIWRAKKAINDLSSKK
jgi:flagellin-like hook-associated protein FlgL